jgi:hypothetical protein
MKTDKPSVYVLHSESEVALMETCDSAHSQYDVRIATLPAEHADAVHHLVKYLARRGAVDLFPVSRQAG